MEVEEGPKMNSALLTVDDFPSKNTKAMVDYFVEKGIKVIFFCTGENVEKYYEEALYALKKGMLVGNHSYSHPAFSALSVEEGIREIEECERVLDKLYQDAGVERKFRPFRFPYGDKGGGNIGGPKMAEFQKYLKENGFHKVDDTKLTYPWWSEFHLDTDIDTFWSFDFAEYRIWQEEGFTKDSVWARMHDTNPQSGAVLFGEDNCHIILMHAHDETEAALPEYYKLFIDHLLEHGMVFDEPGFLI